MEWLNSASTKSLKCLLPRFVSTQVFHTLHEKVNVPAAPCYAELFSDNPSNLLCRNRPQYFIVVDTSRAPKQRATDTLSRKAARILLPLLQVHAMRQHLEQSNHCSPSRLPTEFEKPMLNLSHGCITDWRPRLCGVLRVWFPSLDSGVGRDNRRSSRKMPCGLRFAPLVIRATAGGFRILMDIAK